MGNFCTSSNTVSSFTYRGGAGRSRESVAPKGTVQVDVHSSVRTIEEHAFHYCKSLKIVTVSNGVEKIDKRAFSFCSELETVVLPPSIKSIEEYAFYRCDSLEKINIPNDIETIHRGAFGDSLKSLSLPFRYDLIEIFTDKERLETVVFTSPKSLEKLPTEPLQGNTPLHISVQNNSLVLTNAILKICPTAATQKNTLGQTPLHLCVTNNTRKEITGNVFNAFPEAATTKNEIGKTPIDYWKEMGCNEEFNVFFGNVSSDTTKTYYLLQDDKMTITDEKTLLPRGHHLILEIPQDVARGDRIYTHRSQYPVIYGDLFRDQLQARNLLFNELITEFSKMLEFQDKLVIQRAASIQALCAENVPKNSLLSFHNFSSAALWYQQEILSLVLRVYCEDKYIDRLNIRKDMQKGGRRRSYPYVPSQLEDAERVQSLLKETKKIPKPSESKRKLFLELKDFIVEGLNDDDYRFEGPAQKSLQSLFNKMYVRRGQTKTSILADLTRATLFIKEKSHLYKIVARLQSIIPKSGKPDAMGLHAFLDQVANMQKIPETEIIPYRFKANSSQRDGPPLIYNLNFFHDVPEYHRVGNTEMFVANELQIGLESVIDELRTDHVSYERRRILEAQPLLHNYMKALEEKKKSTLAATTLSATMRSDTDVNLLSAVLEGNFSSRSLQELDETFFSTINNTPNDQVQPLDRLCLNNKMLNLWSKEGKAIVLDGPFELNPYRIYSVDSLYAKMTDHANNISVGICAYFGPYLFQVSARFVGYYDSETIDVITPGINYLTMESISTLPLGCDKVVLVAWGEPKDVDESNNYFHTEALEWKDFLKNNYQGMELKLKTHRERDE